MNLSNVANWCTFAQRHWLCFNFTQVADINLGHSNTLQEHP